MREDGRWLVGTGVAAATYPTRRRPSAARIEAVPGKPYVVSIDASDIGTGAWTALTQIAADALRVPMESRPADRRQPAAEGLGGRRVDRHHLVGPGDHRRGRAAGRPGGPARRAHRHRVRGPGEEAEQYSSHAFGAHFAEVRVDRDSGEVRVPRMTGVFAAGRIINATTGARSSWAA